MAILILYGIIPTFIVEERSPVHLDTYVIELKNLARSHNALASCRGIISSCRWIRPDFGLFENPFDCFAQAIQDSFIVGASNIHWHEVTLIESGRADEFLEELLLGLGSAGAHEQVAVRLGRLHRLFQNGVPPPGRTTAGSGRCT